MPGQTDINKKMEPRFRLRATFVCLQVTLVIAGLIIVTQIQVSNAAYFLEDDYDDTFDELGKSFIGESSTCGMSKLCTQSSKYIIDGEIEQPGEVPFHARLRFFDNENESYNDLPCGAAIIDESHLLTVTDCALSFGPQANGRIDVDFERSTSVKGQNITIKAIVVHAKHNQGDWSHRHSIVLLKTDKPISMSKKESSYKIHEVCLPKQGQTYEDNMKLYTSGWGLTVPPIWTRKPKLATQLMKARLMHVPLSKCKQIWEQFNEKTIEDVHICAGQSTAQSPRVCFGDSGGPLFRCIDGRAELVGLTAFGAVDCVHELPYPMVFTRISAYIDWIERAKKAMKDDEIVVID